MFFLLKSDKWTPYRDYLFEVHEQKATTCLFGLLTVLMMPILLWIARRCENGIQFMFGARRLAQLPTKSFEDGKSIHFLESIVTIPQQCQIPFRPEGLKQKLKVLFGVALSKIYLIALFALIYGLDQFSSTGFRCRNLKDGAEFLLSNDTQPADYLNATFAEIWEMRKENGRNVDWSQDHVNGLLTDFTMTDLYYYDYDEYINDYKQLPQKFSQTGDLIESFNALGFHEVCNVLFLSDLLDYKEIYYNSYNDFRYAPWFMSRNASGTQYQNKHNQLYLK